MLQTDVPAGSILHARLADEIQRQPPGAALEQAMLDYGRLSAILDNGSVSRRKCALVTFTC